MTLALPWRRLSKWAFAYGGAAALIVAAFILLHYVGNQTPYGLVAQKVAAEFEAEPVAWGTRRRDIYYPWEYCYLTGAVLAGAMPSATPLRDALTPRRLPYRTTLETSAPNPCGTLREAVGRDVGAALAARMADPASLPRLRGQQWFGSKALYAIGLRFLTVRGYHEFLRKATYVGFALFGVGLALLGWRAFVVGSPVVVFGAALSGIEYLADVGKGTPHVWGALAPALVALWLRLREGRGAATGPATGLLCFAAGMVSAYLWLLDGANFVAAALIGLVAWLHCASLPVKARAARAAGCMAAYAVGFLGTLLAWALGGGGGGGGSGWSPVAKDALRIVAPDERDLHGRDIGAWAELLPLDASQTHVLITATGVALGMALLVAAWRGWRRDWRAAQEVLWIVGLGAVALVHFALPNDQAHAAARLMYLPLALCWSALAAALLRTPRPVAHASAFLALGGALVVGRLAWQHATTTELLNNKTWLIDGYFNVYLHDNRLIYHRENCEDVDMRRQFYVHVYPKNRRDLQENPDHNAMGHVPITFFFVSKLLFSFGDACAALVALPTFPAAAIETARWCCYEGEPRWRASAQLDFGRFRRMRQLAIAGRPLASDVFDVYRVEQVLIYLREPCTARDVRNRFFLHAFPRRGDETTFSNLDFDFREHGKLWEGRCVAVRALPDDDVRHIKTGQFATGQGRLWTVEFPLSDLSDDPAP